MAPVAYLQHTNSPILTTASFLQLGQLLSAYGELSQNKKFVFLTDSARKSNSALCLIALPVYITRLKLLTDSDTSVDNASRLKVTTGHFPAGTSAQNAKYFQQLAGKSTFNMYDYGSAQDNKKVYGTRSPPSYNLGNIKVLVYMSVGQYDELASLQDTAYLRDSLTGSSCVQYKSYPLGHSSSLLGLAVSDYMADVLTTLKS